MYDVHDWAEVHRLYHREHLNKTAIAKRLGMSRPTVIRLLELSDPPRYERRSTGSKLDAHTDAIAGMLGEDPKVPATVILEHLRRDGYAGGITILKEHVATLRPAFLAARSFQRTSYLPGELAHGDWWELGNEIPVEIQAQTIDRVRGSLRLYLMVALVCLITGIGLLIIARADSAGAPPFLKPSPSSSASGITTEVALSSASIIGRSVGPEEPLSHPG